MRRGRSLTAARSRSDLKIVPLGEISVVLPAASDPRLAVWCDGFVRPALDRRRGEVAMVDNVPSDERRRLATGNPTRVLTVHGGGSYRARNPGIELAGGEILAFTDSDCPPPPAWSSVLPGSALGP